MGYVYYAYNGLALHHRRLLGSATTLPALKRRMAHETGLVLLVETLDGIPTDRPWLFRKAPGRRWRGT